MSEKSLEKLESVLQSVSPSRRSFLRGLLMAGAGAAVLAIPASSLLADDEGDDNGKGKGDGKGKGKGKCKGKGKGKGDGDND